MDITAPITAVLPTRAASSWIKKKKAVNLNVNAKNMRLK